MSSDSGHERWCHEHWCIQDSDLEGVEPSAARDILIECFFEAQKETFARVKKDLGSRAEVEDVRRSVEQAVKLTFKEAGHDFANPTRRALEDVVQILARKAGSWGTPDDIIDHHMIEIQRLLDALARFA